jgi:glycosyltransferase involved in cell wall biosynthesis
VAVAATLHDHSLACPAGGQRLHLYERTVCHEIEPARCAACFPHSPFHAQLTVAGLGRAAWWGGPWFTRAARWGVRQAPALATLFRKQVLARAQPVQAGEIEARLDGLRQVFDAVQLFVAPSRSVADAHERLGLHRSKLLVSDYGFVRPVPRPAVTSPPERDWAPVRIGFVGTLVWHKGLHVLLEAVRQLPAGAFELEVWGALDTFPEYTATLQSMARSLPVRFCGAFHNGHGADIYSRFDLLVVPSLWPENSPLVIHEAFMAGVPVVGARIGGIPELVTDGVDGVLYDAPSPEALAEALRGLILRPDRLAQMAGTLPRVKSIEEDARDWERRYESLVHESASTRAGAA